jgi:hypothetical protein
VTPGAADAARRYSHSDSSVPNLPPDLLVPATAATPAHHIVVQTRPWHGDGEQRDAASLPVLAIGWYGDEGPASEAFVYLVFDRNTHEIYWVSQSMVTRVVSG